MEAIHLLGARKHEHFGFGEVPMLDTARTQVQDDPPWYVSGTPRGMSDMFGINNVVDTIRR